MPPRFSYWTIIAGGLPTAFRAVEREELLPTFTRLKQKQPDAQMKWFARGKLWESPEEARQHNDRRGPQGGPRSADGERRGPEGRPDKPREHRSRDWRPGGEHRDPRQKFKDAKKDRNQRFKAEKFARRPKGDGDQAPRGDWSAKAAPRAKPHGDRPTGPASKDREREHRPSFDRGDKPKRQDWRSKTGGDGERAPRERPNGASRAPQRRDTDRGWKPKGDRPSAPRGDWSAKAAPRAKPHGDRPTGPASKDRERERRPSFDRGDKPKREDWRSKTGGDGERAPRERPNGASRAPQRRDTDRGWKPKGDRPSAPRGDWSAKAAPRAKPHGDRPTGPASKDRERERRPSFDRGDKPKREDWRSNAGGEGRGAHRGAGHGDNQWKPRPPRQESGPGGPARPFTPGKFNRDRVRGGGTEEPAPPTRPHGPNREPKPSEQPKPSSPPRPREPVTQPPGPPERGRLNRNKRKR